MTTVVVMTLVVKVIIQLLQILLSLKMFALDR
jgi:hypothetical protein